MLRASSFLTPDEIRAFGVRSDRTGALLVLHAWAVIAAAMAFFVLWPNLLSLIIAIMIIGGRQLGLAVLMHDAAHGLLFTRKATNDWVGQWLCAYPVVTDLQIYRPYHLKHHRFTQQPEDPDLALSAPFPVTRASMRRKIIRDLTGQVGFARRKAQLLDALGPSWLHWRGRLAEFRETLGRAALANFILFAGLTVIGYWWLYPLLWLLPLLTSYQLASRIRNIAEHAMVPDNNDPMRNTRTTFAGPLTRLLFAPYWVNYHLEHHLLPFAPCWRLKAVHRFLLVRGYRPYMELCSSYREMLMRAASAQVDPEPQEAPPRPGAAQHI